MLKHADFPHSFLVQLLGQRNFILTKLLLFCLVSPKVHVYSYISNWFTSRVRYCFNFKRSELRLYDCNAVSAKRVEQFHEILNEGSYNGWSILFTRLIVETMWHTADIILLNVEQSTPQHRAFTLETLFVNNKSFTVTRRFRNHFDVPCHGTVPSRNTILRWVNNLRKTASALKVKPTGRSRSIHT